MGQKEGKSLKGPNHKNAGRPHKEKGENVYTGGEGELPAGHGHCGGFTMIFWSRMKGKYGEEASKKQKKKQKRSEAGKTGIHVRDTVTSRSVGLDGGA